MDFKYDIMKHPNIGLTADGHGKPYNHGANSLDTTSIMFLDSVPDSIPEFDVSEINTNIEFLTKEEVEKQFHLNDEEEN